MPFGIGLGRELANAGVGRLGWECISIQWVPWDMHRLYVPLYRWLLNMLTYPHAQWSITIPRRSKKRTGKSTASTSTRRPRTQLGAHTPLIHPRDHQQHCGYLPAHMARRCGGPLHRDPHLSRSTPFPLSLTSHMSRTLVLSRRTSGHCRKACRTYYVLYLPFSPLFRGHIIPH